MSNKTRVRTEAQRAAEKNRRNALRRLAREAKA